MALIIISFHHLKIISRSRLSRTKMIDDKIPQPRTNLVLQHEDRSEVQIPSKVGIGPKSAFYSLESFGRGAQRINTAAKDLSTTTSHDKVSHNLILLTIFCGMISLNQVGLFGSGHSIPDDSSLSTCEGTNERKCVTDPKSNTKFVLSPIPVFSCQEHLDLSRLSSIKADTSGINPKAFLVATKDAALINGFCHKQRHTNHNKIYDDILKAFLVASKDTASIDSYCDTVSRKECHDVADTVCADVQERMCQVKPVQETVSRQQCSSPSSGLLPKSLTNMLRCQGYLAGVSLNPERPRDPFDDVKIRIVSRPAPPQSPASVAISMRGSAQTSSARTWPTLWALMPMRGSVRSPRDLFRTPSSRGNVKLSKRYPGRDP